MQHNADAPGYKRREARCRLSRKTPRSLVRVTRPEIIKDLLEAKMKAVETQPCSVCYETNCQKRDCFEIGVYRATLNQVYGRRSPKSRRPSYVIRKEIDNG